MRFFRPVPRVAAAASGDAGALAALLQRCGEPVSEAEVESWLRGGFEVFKATLDGAVVGMVRCAFPTGACVIDQLVVDPDHRRRGFGQYLAEHALARARRAGAPKAWMQVAVGDDAAARLLHKLGFREAARAGHGSGEMLLVEMSL